MFKEEHLSTAFIEKGIQVNNLLLLGFRSLLSNQLFNRFLDSLLILLSISIITFLFVRINLEIKSINITAIILFISVLMASFYKFGCVQKIIPLIGTAGIGILFGYLLFMLCSSSSDSMWIYRFFLFPLIYLFLLFCYLLRSWFSKNKLLITLSGLITIFLIFSLLFHHLNLELKIDLAKAIPIKSGDPLAALRMNPSISPEALEREKIRLGLDKPMIQQYFLWFKGVVMNGDLGITQQGKKVIDAVAEPLRNSIVLNVIVMFFSWLISIPLGIIAAINRNKFWDKFILNFSSLSLTTPSFLLSIFALSLALKVSFANIGGITSVNFADLNFFQKIGDLVLHLFFPVFVLTFVSLGMPIRQMRANLLDVLNEDYIFAAKARGIPKYKIIFKHAFPNAINPLITILGLEFANLVSGAALTEMILGYPGIGALILEAAQKMDINLIMFNLILGASMLLIGNLLADLLLQLVDPRTRKKEV